MPKCSYRISAHKNPRKEAYPFVDLLVSRSSYLHFTTLISLKEDQTEELTKS